MTNSTTLKDYTYKIEEYGVLTEEVKYLIDYILRDIEEFITRNLKNNSDIENLRRMQILSYIIQEKAEYTSTELLKMRDKLISTK